MEEIEEAEEENNYDSEVLQKKKRFIEMDDFSDNSPDKKEHNSHNSQNDRNEHDNEFELKEKDHSSDSLKEGLL